jgi:hypothetical protein
MARGSAQHTTGMMYGRQRLALQPQRAISDMKLRAARISQALTSGNEAMISETRGFLRSAPPQDWFSATAGTQVTFADDRQIVDAALVSTARLLASAVLQNDEQATRLCRDGRAALQFLADEFDIVSPTTGLESAVRRKLVPLLSKANMVGADGTVLTWDSYLARMNVVARKVMAAQIATVLLRNSHTLESHLGYADTALDRLTLQDRRLLARLLFSAADPGQSRRGVRADFSRMIAQCMGR